MNPRELVLDLALELRQAVLPLLGSHAGRAEEGAAPGGDVTFAIDERAEAHLERFCAERAPGVAFFSEDRGLVEPAGGADHVLVVDPVDGTRPAMAGLESACTAVAVAPLRGPDGPTMADVLAAAVVEIKSGDRFVAVRGEGLEATAPVRLSANTDVDRLFWVYGLRGRPARAVVEVIADLLDRSSTRGAVFDLGSASFDLTRIATGQLDAYVEPSPRIVAEVPGMAEAFRRVGGGAILNNTPYDLAAAVLCVQEAGAVVTDAAGRPLDDQPLLGSGPEFQMSCVAAANEAVHAAVLTEVEAGIERLRRGATGR